MSGLLELAARCEAAEGPDRELEHAIADAVIGPVKPPYRRGFCFSYTASVDAAMMLVPEGWHLFSLGETRFMLGGPWLAQLDDWQEIPARHHATAATPALALCAAALKARSAAASAAPTPRPAADDAEARGEGAA